MDLRAVLVDDEQLTRDELGYLLGRIGGVDVIGQASNGVEALATVDRLQPDVVFLDVQMPGLTGFEVARRMLDGDASPHIIFVTAYDQHAIEAFEVNAVDYLLKPVDQARLELALQRARRRMPVDPPAGRAADAAGSPASDINSAQIERIVQLVAERQNRRERLAIKVGERFLLVQAEEILRVACRRRRDGRDQPAYRHIELPDARRLQARLDPDVFWRVHRSHLVNINKIKEIIPWFSRNYILRMKDEKSTEIPVSRTQTRRLRNT
jgi:two-component system LytT family response regulator/two-component system response regulator LytT